MPPSTPNAVQQRLQDLESHLEQENPVLLSAVRGFRTIDRIAHRMGVLPRNRTFTTQIPWWPLISVLGTFSAGKSSFINHYLGQKLQRSGNQAVDDRFTVIVYSPESVSHTLPGVSLDSDPRFPFYQMSRDIGQPGGEVQSIDAYLQLRTCRSDRLRGKILIDSPGFDADAQRTATLRIANHMIALSDLVLIMFDARHPEPGAMRDTLKHLVSETIHRPDSSKCLYILNQLDTAAGEDNPEDVVAAWLRALGESGLTAGRFYTIYNPDLAIEIPDESRRQRFEKKRDADLAEIHQRMEGVEIERAYRIVAALRKTATDFHDSVAPTLKAALARWRALVLFGDFAVFGLALTLFLFWSIRAGHWQLFSYRPEWLELLRTNTSWGVETLVVLLILLTLGIHFGIRRLAFANVLPWLEKQVAQRRPPGDLVAAFTRNTRFWRPVLMASPAGWNRKARRSVDAVLQDCETYVQTLNERFTNPRGLRDARNQAPARGSEI